MLQIILIVQSIIQMFRGNTPVNNTNTNSVLENSSNNTTNKNTTNIF